MPLFDWCQKARKREIVSREFSSVSQSCPTPCNPMDCSTLVHHKQSISQLTKLTRTHVHHQLTKLTQIHVHRVSDSTQPSFVTPSPSTFNLFQHQGLFKWVSASHWVTKILELQFQHQSFQWIFRTGFLYDGLLESSCSPRDSQESTPTPQFKSINSLVLSFLYSPTFTSIHDYWKNQSLE